MATLTNAVFLMVAILNALNLVRGDCEATSKVLKVIGGKSFNKSIRSISDTDEFWQKKSAVVDSEMQKVLGSQAGFQTEKEFQANTIVMEKKLREYKKEPFPPSINFLKAKRMIEESEIYRIIKKVPKGANLYGTVVTSVESDFYYNLTYEPYLYFRYQGNFKFVYSKTRPSSGWRLLANLRLSQDFDYVDELNNAIQESLQISPKLYDVESARSDRQDVLEIYLNLTDYRPNFVKLFRRTLEILHADNVMYAELRYHFPELYDLDGKTTTPVEALQICQDILDDFIATHPDFKGVRLIYYAPLHNVLPEKVPEFRQIAVDLQKSNPKLFAGFGFIRQETGQPPLSQFVEELLKFPREIRFFFTAGLSESWGEDADHNLVDALLLDSFRIAEGLALFKHPFVVDQLREKGIAVEMSPIYVQTLNYVRDLRLHPNAILTARDFPVVIGNTGGTYWNATGLSYDWYEFFMAMTPKYCDLRCLKKLALNSWTYSTLSGEEKRNAIKDWQIKWDTFVDNMLKSYYRNENSL